MTLPHVLWIGGAPGCGKTSIGRRLAHRYDLQAYNSDAHTWDHHDRSLANADPGAARWEAMTPDERWVAMPPAEMAEFSLEMNAERFEKMVEDVAQGPAAPMVVMEGTPLLPWLVERYLADRAAAVWLVPTPEFQRDRLLERDMTTWNEASDPDRAVANRIDRERLVSDVIARAARERGYTVLTVDGTRDLDAMEALVEESLGPAIAQGARAQTGAELRAIRRSENETVLHQVQTYLERVPAAGTPDTAVVPFSCECGTSGCELQPQISIAAYERLVNGGEFLDGHAAGVTL